MHVVRTLSFFLTATALVSSFLRADAAEPLPKIVLVGDSIRLSYTAEVTRQLNGRAVVVGPKANGQDSANVRKHLTEWVIQEDPAIVHFNCGIHDTKKDLASGEFQVSPEAYAENLRAIVQRIRQETRAKVTFATSTPILDDRAAAARAGRDYQLLGASIEKYNAIAKQVMQELHVPIDDLHSAVTSIEPPLTVGQLIGSDGVHFTSIGTELLGKHVAQFLLVQLEAKPASGQPEPAQ